MRPVLGAPAPWRPATLVCVWVPRGAAGQIKKQSIFIRKSREDKNGFREGTGGPTTIGLLLLPIDSIVVLESDLRSQASRHAAHTHAHAHEKHKNPKTSTHPKSN
jgi:hypothetical protein